jgi:hypothetical protein
MSGKIVQVQPVYSQHECKCRNSKRISFCFKLSKTTAESKEMYENLYGNKAPCLMHIFEVLKAGRNDSGLGCQKLLKIQKELEKFTE